MDFKNGILLINPDPAEKNSISLAFIAAYARSMGYNADIFDFGDNIPVSLSSIAAYIYENNPLLIGISSYQKTMFNIKQLAAILKDISDTPIILGGPQVPGMPSDALNELYNVDFLCLGDGEKVCLDMLNAFDQGKDIAGIRGIAYKSSGKVYCNDPAIAEIYLDTYPSPYMSGVLLPDTVNSNIILTSRGCESTCSFCVTPFLNPGGIRYHSKERVLDEIAYLYSKNVKKFWIADPTFTSDRERTASILSEIINTGIKADFWCQTRADRLDYELIRLLKKAGFNTVALGLESIDRKSLEIIKKRQDPDGFITTVEQLQDNSINVEIMHIIGIPGADFESIISTFNFINKLGIVFSGNSSGKEFEFIFGSPAYAKLEEYPIKDEYASQRPKYISLGNGFSSDTLNKDEYSTVIKQLKSYRKMAYALAHHKNNRSSNINTDCFSDIINDFYNFTDSRSQASVLNTEIFTSNNLIIDNLTGDLSFRSALAFLDPGKSILRDKELCYSLQRYSSPLYKLNIYFYLNRFDLEKDIVSIRNNLKSIISKPEDTDIPSFYIPDNENQVYMLFDIESASKEDFIKYSDYFEKFAAKTVAFLLLSSEKNTVKLYNKLRDFSNCATYIAIFSPEKNYNAVLELACSADLNTTVLFLGENMYTTDGKKHYLPVRKNNNCLFIHN